MISVCSFPPNLVFLGAFYRRDCRGSNGLRFPWNHAHFVLLAVGRRRAYSDLSGRHSSHPRWQGWWLGDGEFMNWSDSMALRELMISCFSFLVNRSVWMNGRLRARRRSWNARWTSVKSSSLFPVANSSTLKWIPRASWMNTPSARKWPPR